MATIDPRRAWEPYEPGDSNPWTLQKVGHLYRRAAFGARWDELQGGLALGPQKLVDNLLKGGEAPDPASEERARYMAESIRKSNNILQLAPWWVYRLLNTGHPLREKLTLFWHNHFATSNAKVLNAGHMLGQYDLLYKHALGNFRPMLEGISEDDPAMMIWLDTVESKKGKPNENYARELMELFSLGVGNYTEKDIREAAKAFTGYEIVGRKAHFNAAQHDDGDKTVLGQTGRWKGKDIVRIMLEQKACPRFIARKLYRYLINETAEPTPELIEPLAERFRKDFNIAGLVGTVLRSNLFFSEHAYRGRVKAPVDFALGIVRALEGPVAPVVIDGALENLGQHLFHPPSVKGWDGGQTWLNGQTLLFRQNFALTLCQTRRRPPGEEDSSPLPVFLAKRHAKKDDRELIDFFLALFLQDDAADETRHRLADYLADARRARYPVYWSERRAAEHPIVSACHLVLTLPEFQLD
jgi:hypothetical protein